MNTVKRVVIVPYKLASKGAKSLRNALRIAQNKPVLYVSPASKFYQPRWTDYIINWGNSNEWPWINLTDKKPWKNVTNKLTFFKMVDEHNKTFKDSFVNIPDWTTDDEIAWEWVNDNNDTVFARTILNGHSGKGIRVITKEEGVMYEAPLYVKYKKKRHEYRVHFAQENAGAYVVIDITQKKKRKGFENVNTKIRNHQNGWVYAREDIYLPEDLKTQALNAALCSKLPFGAVDLIWNEKENKSYVLEINSAPGIEGTTLQKYVNFFVKDITK